MPFFSNLIEYRHLIYQLVARDFQARYKGSVLGVAWSFFTPLFMLLIYTFIFSVVFKARWGISGDGESTYEFALILFSGLIVYNLFAECITRSPAIIVTNSNLVSKVVFPLEILPVVTVLSSMIHLIISFVIWVIGFIVVFHNVHWTLALFPLAILPYILLMFGLTWIVSSLGVYLKDLTQLVSVIASALMFLSPIFYPISALPESFKSLLYLNPLTYVIELVRDIIYWGVMPDIFSYLVYLISSLLFCYIGYVWFQLTRTGFTDVI